MSHITQIISPISTDIIDRAIRDTDLIPDFTSAADVIWHTPAGPYLAVSAAIDQALDDWAYDNGMPAAAVSAAQREAIAARLMARCWSEYRGTAPDVDPAFDALCQANDARRGMAAE